MKKELSDESVTSLEKKYFVVETMKDIVQLSMFNIVFWN
jgi:hypothetical protein